MKKGEYKICYGKFKIIHANIPLTIENKIHFGIKFLLYGNSFIFIFSSFLIPSKFSFKCALTDHDEII